MVRTPMKSKGAPSNLRRNYSLRSGKTKDRVSTRHSMVSSNIVQKEKPKQNETQGEVSSSHHEEEENEVQQEDVEQEEVDQEEENEVQQEDVAKPSDHPSTFERDVPGRILEEIIDSFVIKRARDPPRIPLCRLMENEAIRAVGPDVEGLIAKFERDGYSMFGAPFIVGFKIPGKYVTENDVLEWGPLWEEVNREFEANLPPEWEDLQGKKFIVYDGKHRLKTWSSLIKTQYSMVKWRHCCVKVHFVEVDRNTQGEFLLALKTQNETGRTTVCTNFGQEIFLFQKLAMASKESLLKDFPAEWIHWIEVELACERRGAKGTWYNAPAVLLAMLVWKEEFDTHLAKEMVDIIDPSIPMQDKMFMARGKTEKIFKERAYKMLSIANPANGQGFFSLLYNYNWVREKDLVGLTKDKVHSLATAKLNAGRKRDILFSMLKCRLDDPSCERYQSAQKFRLYLKKEWYWEHIFKQCLKIKGKLVEELPEGFEAWFDAQRKAHLDEAFCDIWGRMNTKESDEKIPDLLTSTKRIFYRWIIKLYDENTLDELPSFVEEWRDTKVEGCMYPPWMLERGLSDWEVQFCPWWIDFPIGEYPIIEGHLYKEHAHKRDVGETDEVGSVSKKTFSNKGASTSQKKGTNTGAISESGMSSIKKRLEYMKHKPPKKISTKSAKNSAEPERSTDLADEIYSKRDILIASSLLSVLDISTEHEGRFAMFLRKANVDGLYLHGEESDIVASLFFADFPTGCLVEQTKIDTVPSWNEFSQKLSKRVANLASLFVADNGWYITLCSTDHFGIVCGHATINEFKLKQTILLMIPEGYVRKNTHERVEVLLLGMFYRKGNRPVYDRQAGEVIDKKAFDAQSGFLVEREDVDLIGEGALRGPAERSLDFYRWLITTFTTERTSVIDVFAGCGGLGIACAERHRHCFCVDFDQTIFDRHLAFFGEIPVSPLAISTHASDALNEGENTDWEQYEP